MKAAEAPMKREPGPQAPLVLSYLQLRMAVGIIGVALPLVLAVGKILLQGPGIQCSISDYYYTDTGSIFVGSLCAIGVFLISCRGYDRKDEIGGSLAGIFAVGVALFPTTRDTCINPGITATGVAHLTFATLLFLTLAYFCLVLFTKTSYGQPTPQKRKRNGVYRVCGWTILACILLIAVSKLPGIKPAVNGLRPVFWLEAIAVMVFGLAWLIKGETFLKDEVV
jgi:hypothetical protein